MNANRRKAISFNITSTELISNVFSQIVIYHGRLYVEHRTHQKLSINTMNDCSYTYANYRRCKSERNMQIIKFESPLSYVVRSYGYKKQQLAHPLHVISDQLQLRNDLRSIGNTSKTSEAMNG